MVKFANFAVFALGACQVASAVPLKWFKTIGDSVVKIWPLQVAGDVIESTSAQLGNPDKAVMDSTHTQYIANTLASLPLTGSCTAANIVKRKEWGNLTPAERFDYTAAMHCLARLPSKTPSDFAPGARSRFDDFLVGHIVNTLTVHFSGFFLPWHRQLVWEMEQALRNECNYKGYHPYWDWSKWADLAPESNPLWDGSNTSISGNGVYVPHGTINITLPGGGLLFETPPGTGGGCIYNGPFANWSVNLGPVSGLDGFGGPPNPRPDGLGYNPHCIYRDFDAGLLRSQNSYRNVTQLILNSTNIHEFHPEAEMGVHGGGHTFIGGGNNDLFASAGDPAFYMHHTMFDRIWAIWQSRDFDSRVYKDGLDGTHTFFNDPPSSNVTLDDVIYLGPAFQNTTVREVMSPTSGRFCYLYD